MLVPLLLPPPLFNCEEESNPVSPSSSTSTSLSSSISCSSVGFGFSSWFIDVDGPVVSIMSSAVLLLPGCCWGSSIMWITLFSSVVHLYGIPQPINYWGLSHRQKVPIFPQLSSFWDIFVACPSPLSPEFQLQAFSTARLSNEKAISWGFKLFGRNAALQPCHSKISKGKKRS